MRFQFAFKTLLAAALAFVSAVLQAASQAPVAAENAMVVTAQHLATRVGVDVLKNGGNAVDAAVAVGYALAVVYPAAGNLGGGGFMTIKLADGRKTFIDFREKAHGADLWGGGGAQSGTEAGTGDRFRRPIKSKRPDEANDFIGSFFFIEVERE